LALRAIGQDLAKPLPMDLEVEVQADRLVVEYHDTYDQPQREEMTNSKLYKLQRRYYGSAGRFNPLKMWRERQN
jgi:hypothetical protein